MRARVLLSVPRAALVGDSAPRALIALRGGAASLGPLSADRLADLNIVVALTCAPFFLAPGASGVPARFLGRVNSMSPAVFWMGFCMLLLAALHAYVRFYVQTPAIDHLAFFAAQYALTAAAHYWKLAEGEVVGAGALVWLMPMALASAYFAFA